MKIPFNIHTLSAILIFQVTITSAQKTYSDPFRQKTKNHPSHKKNKQQENNFAKIVMQSKKKNNKNLADNLHAQDGFLPNPFESRVVQQKNKQTSSPFAVKEKRTFFRRKNKKQEHLSDVFATQPAKRKNKKESSAFAEKERIPLIRLKKKETESESAFGYKVHSPLIRLRKKQPEDRYAGDAFAQKVNNAKGWERLKEQNKKRRKKGKMPTDGYGDAFASVTFMFPTSFDTDPFSKKVKGKDKWSLMKKKNEKNPLFDGLGDGFSSENVGYQSDVDTDIFGGKRKQRTKKHFKGEKPLIFTKKPKTPKKKKSEESFTVSPRDKKKDLKERRRKSNEMKLFQKGVLPK